MENLKIRVTTKQESKEAQELFFDLGYGWHGKGKVVSYSDKILSDYFGWLVLRKPSYLTKTVIQMGSGFEDCKEITLPQLRDMVVLNRNDPKDATHTDQDNWKWYIGADSYVWQAGNSQQLKQWDQSSLAMVDLKPIQKGQTVKEYLEKQIDGTYKLLVNPVVVIGEFIEVPSGAEVLASTKNGLIFYKKHDDGFAYCFFGEDDWGGTFTNPYDNLGSFVNKLLWQRESLNDKVASAEVARQELKGVDNVNHPKHYTSDPSGIECIEITRHRNFNIGNAIKYLWRNGLKDSDSQIQDLEKAIWYIQDEINRLSK